MKTKKTNPVQAYLRALKRDLWLRGLSDPETLAEIEGHLLEAVEQGRREGLSAAAAEQRAIARFGPVRTVGASFEKERMDAMQKVLLIIGILAGLLIAYVDSRPTWDDTGITAGSMLLVSGLLTLLGHRRPWLIALAVGLWTPLYETYLSRNFSFPGVVLLPVVIFLICAVGAYAGWAARLAARKVFQPA
jgi:hypothetical protein